jgi:hypothetical protein
MESEIVRVPVGRPLQVSDIDRVVIDTNEVSSRRCPSEPTPESSNNANHPTRSCFHLCLLGGLRRIALMPMLPSGVVHLAGSPIPLELGERRHAVSRGHAIVATYPANRRLRR